jgi:hypothetical protein
MKITTLRRTRGVRAPHLAVLLLVLGAACRDPATRPAGFSNPAPSADTTGTNGGSVARISDPMLAAGLVASDPTSPSTAPITFSDAGATGVAQIAENASYVSLLPGSMPDGREATITNRRTGTHVSVTLLDGGFDPQPISAAVGDWVDVAVTRANGTVAFASVLVVAKKPPRIVRTVPPRGATDVPISLRMFIVFSEPIDAATVTSATILVTTADSAVAGTLHLVPSNDAMVEFTPNGLLAPSTRYVLTVQQMVADRSGDPLEAAAHVDFTTAAAAVPVGGALSVAVAGYSTCALNDAGRARCWGGNTYGWLGVELPKPSVECADPDGFLDAGQCVLTPSPVMGQLTFQSIAMGLAHVCGIALLGDAYCWGMNMEGELGTGAHAGASAPVPVAGGHRFAVLAAGTSFTCGLTGAGEAFCWGTMTLGSFVPPSDARVFGLAPKRVAGGMTFTRLAVGDLHACAISQAGTAYCWGANNLGQLGVGNLPLEPCTADSCASVPVPVAGGLRFTAIAASHVHTCAVASDGRAYCWGAWHGSDRTQLSRTPELVPGGHAFVSVAAGYSGASCGIGSAGDLWCWGRTISGPGGTLPVRVAPDIAFASVTISVSDMCGRATDGTLYCWGGNWNGEIGNGSFKSSAVPLWVQLQ